MKKKTKNAARKKGGVNALMVKRLPQEGGWRLRRPEWGGFGIGVERGGEKKLKLGWSSLKE